METQLVTKKSSRLLTEYYVSVFLFMVFLFVSVATFVLRPKLNELKAANAEIDAVLQELTQEQNYLNSLEQSILAAENIPETALAQVEHALPRDPKIPELLVLFGSTGERTGVKVTNLSFAETRQASTRAPSARTASSTVSEIQINVAVTAANYPQMKRFLRDLEASLRLLDVIGIHVSMSPDGASAYAIQLKTYAYKSK